MILIIIITSGLIDLIFTDVIHVARKAIAICEQVRPVKNNLIKSNFVCMYQGFPSRKKDIIFIRLSLIKIRLPLRTPLYEFDKTIFVL
jgi:hypothetical protein